MFSLPWLELTRFKRHTITRLAMIVVAVIPAIYGGLYLASNWDPTSHLDRLQAAVVNEDTGAEKPNSDGERLNAGDELVDKITPKGEGGFDWQETSAQEAKDGYRPDFESEAAAEEREAKAAKAPSNKRAPDAKNKEA